MKIFLAGSFYKKKELRSIRSVLQALGVEVISSWLDDHGGIDIEYMPSPEKRSAIIIANELEIRDCDTFLVIAEHTDVGGNTMFEMGYAAALNKKIVFIGERSLLAHYRPWTIHKNTLTEWMMEAID